RRWAPRTPRASVQTATIAGSRRLDEERERAAAQTCESCHRKSSIPAARTGEKSRARNYCATPTGEGARTILTAVRERNYHRASGIARSPQTRFGDGKVFAMQFTRSRGLDLLWAPSGLSVRTDVGQRLRLSASALGVMDSLLFVVMA